MKKADQKPKKHKPSSIHDEPLNPIVLVPAAGRQPARERGGNLLESITKVRAKIKDFYLDGDEENAEPSESNGSTQDPGTNRSEFYPEGYHNSPRVERLDLQPLDSYRSGQSPPSYRPHKTSTRQPPTTRPSTRSTQSFVSIDSARNGASPILYQQHRRSSDGSSPQFFPPQQLVSTQVRYSPLTQRPRVGKHHDLSVDTARNKATEDWQDGKTLTECNAYMLSYDLCSDLTCLVGEQEEPVPAHSYMLMSRSAHFYRILKQERRHADKIISVPGVTPEIFRKLLQYIYTDQLELDVPLAAALLEAADKYGTPTLKSKCFEHLLSELSSDNAVTILEQAHKYREHTIYDRCLHFIFINAVDVLKTPNFKELCRECLEKVAGADELNADEVTVYDALMVWAQAECARRKLQPNDKNRRVALDKLLFSVRFPIIDVRIFTQKLSHREVLNQEEKILLYQHFHGQTHKLPDHFNKRHRKQYVVNPDVIAANQPNQNSSATNGAGDPYDFGLMPNTDPKSNPKHYDPMFIDSRLPVYRVVRFKGITGSWQINGADAISFKCSQTIVLRGVQVFSPQKLASSSYTVNLAVFDDMRNEVRNEEVHIIPDKSKVQDVRLSDPVRVPVGRVFTVHTVIKGGPTIRGMDGVKTVSSEGVTFEFINSNRSLNGTDVTMGQIPSILFSVP